MVSVSDSWNHRIAEFFFCEIIKGLQPTVRFFSDKKTTTGSSMLRVDFYSLTLEGFISIKPIRTHILKIGLDGVRFGFIPNTYVCIVTNVLY